ncbi:hypothetical protein [Candidatus Deferrimicrobium sp.]|uniref:hypothetical protein n=1 Tax=Candidatus Deferrimicrobium sp. TaxID=3060586 RepID=UPI002ED08A61
MDRALLHASISTSVQVADLSILGQLIFERMFPHADSQGRLPGHPRKVKATVIPMVDASAEQVAEQLQKMHDLELIVWYEPDAEKYVQLVSWWRYQDRRFARPSKYPAPEGWKDRIRYSDPHEPKRFILENWEGVFGRPRIGKCKGDPPPKPPIHNSYVGNLHRPPTQEAQNDPTASASDLKPTSSSESGDSDSSKSSGNGKNTEGVQAFFDLWNLEAKTLPKATKLTDTRRRKILARLRERPLQEWGEVFRRMERSSFLRGETGGSFRADLDWIIANEGNTFKVVEGRYDDREKRSAASPMRDATGKIL